MSDHQYFESVKEAFGEPTADKYRRIWVALPAGSRKKFDLIVMSALKGNTNIDTCLSLWSGQQRREDEKRERLQRFQAGYTERRA